MEFVVTYKLLFKNELLKIFSFM